MTQAEGQVLELAITGMHCASCAALIEETLSGTEGVTGATVDLEAASASVTFDPTVISPDRLCALVAEVGYQASTVGPASC